MGCKTRFTLAWLLRRALRVVYLCRAEQGQETAFLAAYLDASNALRENPDLEKQVPSLDAAVCLGE